MSCAPNWKQTTLPAEVVTVDHAIEWVRAHVGQGDAPAQALARARDPGLLVSDVGAKWLRLLEDDERCAPATLKGHRNHVNNWVLPEWGTWPIAKLNSIEEGVPALRAWLRKLRKEKHARTVLHMFSSFTLLVDAAIAERWIKVPVAEGWQSPESIAWVRAAANVLRHPAVRDELPEPEDGEVMVIPLEWIQKLIDCPEVPLERRARYAIAFTSGMRDGEIAGVQLCRLARDATPATVRIEQAVALVGKKGRGGFAQPKAPKTKGSKRTLPIHAAADSAIAEWLSEGWPRLVGRLPGPGDYLFPRPDGQASRPRSAEMFRGDLEAAGLPTQLDGKALEFKAARSSFLTWLDEAGVSERVRQRLAGHRAATVTEQHYTRRELEQLAEAVAHIKLEWRPKGAPEGLCTVTATVHPLHSKSQIDRDLPAPPRRLERPTNGLGNGQPISTGADSSGQSLSNRPLEARRDSGQTGPAADSDRVSTQVPVQKPAQNSGPGLARTRAPAPARSAKKGAR